MIIVRLITGHVVKIENYTSMTAEDIYRSYNENNIIKIYDYIFNVHQIAYIEIQ